MKPLSGITVLDISRLLPGGFASLLLARQGARVIKIEEPGVGDYYRGLTGGKEFIDLGHFHEINSGKELVTLNLKTDQGKRIFQKLVRRTDVLIENFRPGTLQRLGIPYSILSKWNPKLVLCSITGDGQRGSRLGGHDLNYLALSGLLSLIRGPKGAPVLPEFQIIDLAAGYRSVVLILAALQQRVRTKRGVWIDSAMIDVGREMARLYTTARGEIGLRPLRGVPNYRLYRTKDGRYVAFGALEPKFIRNFGRATGVLQRVGRLRLKALQRLFLSKTAREWARLSSRYDFCLSPMLDVAKACGVARGGDLPKMGRDNLKVLGAIGYPRSQIKRLKKEGIL